MNSSISGTLLIGALAVVLAARPARAEELDPKYKEVVNKGLAWVAKTQHRDAIGTPTAASIPPP